MRLTGPGYAWATQFQNENHALVAEDEPESCLNKKAPTLTGPQIQIRGHLQRADQK